MEKLIKKAHDKITRTKGREYAPTAVEIENEINKSLTAVDWLVKELELEGYDYTVQQAKEMEKQQIMKAVDRGFDEGCKFPEDIKLNNAEQYYNETYNK
jgi:hypothetical protein